jgi:Ca2+-transporting ATPase
MADAVSIPDVHAGLSHAEVLALQKKWGPNKIRAQRRSLWQKLRPFVSDPLLSLLLVTALIYFTLGRSSEGALMLAAVAIVTSISYFQEYRSARALSALQQLVEPLVRVIRNGAEVQLPAAQLVPGDTIVVSEGERIPADARVLEANDLTVNESLLTGESFAVTKNAGEPDLFQGTLVNTGQCLARVKATGMNTRLGKLGAIVDTAAPQRTALQAATLRLVRLLTLLGVVAFLLLFAINYFRSGNLLASLLYGMTLAMAAIPEEIPVAFTTFMALGAARLSRRGILTRNPHTIEQLGAVNVICLDKTGTITENRMELRLVWDAASRQLYDLQEATDVPLHPLHIGALASETVPFDEMEKAIWSAYKARVRGTAAAPEIVHEYPLGSSPPMMTHLYAEGEGYLAAAKGAPEKILSVCGLSEAEKSAVLQQVHLLAVQGFRILGIASARNITRWLPAQEDYRFTFDGLLALYDPPKKEAAVFIDKLRKAGIRVMLLTGDYPETARHIASAVGIKNTGRIRTGTEVMEANDTELDRMSTETNLFARMHPEAKMRVILSLKRQGAITAMTGDGVNDAPAIRKADVGIAMGNRGTEFSRQAADLVLTDDKLEKIIVALEDGRKIFQNLKKVTRYILSIHIPIFAVAVLPLVLQWRYQNIFAPVHVIFLELIMGPTCSLFYEGEPAMPGTMSLPPRNPASGLLTHREAFMGSLQGIMISAGLLVLYFYTMSEESIARTRTLVFVSLTFSNLLLTFANRSSTIPLRRTKAQRNRFSWAVLAGSLLFCALILLLPAVRMLFQFELPTVAQLGMACGISVLSVLWAEPLKALGGNAQKQGASAAWSERLKSSAASWAQRQH